MWRAGAAAQQHRTTENMPRANIVDKTCTTDDPKKVEGADVKKAFPFRPVQFYAEPRAAKKLLGWTPKWTLEAALAERWVFFQHPAAARRTRPSPTTT